MSRKRKQHKTTPITIHYLIEDRWAHTHGMEALGLPELEIRNVPSLFVEAAMALLQHVCDYMQKPGVVVKAGELMTTSPKTRFQFKASEPIPGEEDHYEVERFQLVGIEPTCEGSQHE